MLPRRLSLLLVVTACVAPTSSPVVGPQSLARGPATPIAVVDEVMSFPSSATGGNTFAVAPDGTIVVVATPPSPQPGGGMRVIALDDHLAKRWELAAPTEIRGLLSLDAATVVASVIAPADDMELKLVDGRGTVTATSTFQQLVGAPCGYANREWLAAEPGGLVAFVACGSPRQLWWVHVAADLRTATHEPAYGNVPVYARQWMLPPANTELAVLRGGQHQVLVPGLDYGEHRGAGAATTAIGDDLIVGGWAFERRTEPPWFTTRGFVTRLGRRPWTTELMPEHATSDPQHIVSVATAADGALLAAVEYGREGRVTGQRLPAPASGDPEPGVRALARGVAVAELDSERGDVRALLVPRPHRAWNGSFVLRVGATAQHLIVADDKQVVIFPRRGRAIAPVAETPVAEPPPVDTLPAVAAVTPLAERWAEVCGVRVRQKLDAPCRLENVAIGRDGTIAAAGSYYRGNNQIGTRRLPKQAFETGLLVVYGPDGAVRWQKVFGVSWHNEASSVVVRDDGRVVITGVHGNGFAIDGVRLPERVVRKVKGQDMAFEANTGFVAVFDPAGKLELLEDLDVLALGERSTASERTCWGGLGRGTAADEVWLIARCPQATLRVPLRGITAGPPVTVARPELVVDSSWVVEPSGRMLATHLGPSSTELVATDGRAFGALPLITDRVFGPRVASMAGGAWTAMTTTPSHTGAAARLVVAHTDLARGSSSARLIASGPRATIDAITIDDQGRPILAVQVSDEPLVIGGQTITPQTMEAGSQLAGRAFVRLTADGARIDRVFVPAMKTTCVHPSHARVTTMAARGDALAVSLSFGLDAHCGVYDEPSTVVVFAAP